MFSLAELPNVGHRTTTEEGVNELLCGGKAEHHALKLELGHMPTRLECVEKGNGMKRWNDANRGVLWVREQVVKQAVRTRTGKNAVSSDNTVNVLQFNDPARVMEHLAHGRLDCNHRIEAMEVRRRYLEERLSSLEAGEARDACEAQLRELTASGIPVVFCAFQTAAVAKVWSRQLNADRDVTVPPPPF